MKRKRIISHMKEQDKTSEKQLNEKIGNLQIKKEKKKKKPQNNDTEHDLGSQTGEDTRNIYQRHRRTKEQTEMNNTLEEINTRISEAEEQISDLEGRMVEITAFCSVLSIFLFIFCSRNRV